MALQITLFGLMACLATLAQADNIFCYYSSFAYKRHGKGNFLPENINPHLCTHIIYAFVDITPDGRDLRPINKIDQGPDGLYARTMALKEKNPSLKILLAVGGWRVGSKPFVPMVESEDNRRTWIKNVVNYLRRHNFDGFDIDWEFPATRGSPPEDKYRFTLLMKGLYEAFQDESTRTGKEKLILTLATASGTYYIDQSYEADKIYKYIDFMLLMTYNYHGQWEKLTGHHSGLYRHKDDPTTGEKAQLFQQWSIDYWLNMGVPKDKLIVGIPTYGMSFTLADSSNNGVRALATGGGKMGEYTTETGIMAYYEVCKNLRDRGWTSVWIDDQAVPYAYSGDQWVGYEDQESIILKARNIKSRGLAGAFVWSVEMDDFKGTCGEGKYPLLTKIQDTLGDNSGKASRDLQSDTDHKGSSEISHKLKQQHKVTAPSEPPKPDTEESINQAAKGLKKKYANIINAAAAGSESKPEKEVSSSKQSSEEAVVDKPEAGHQSAWWLGNAWKGKNKDWYRENKNQDSHVKEDKTKDLPIKKEKTSDSHVKSVKIENLQTKKGKTDNSKTWKTKSENVNTRKNKPAFNEVPTKSPEWYLPGESSSSSEESKEVEIVDTNLCGHLGVGTFADPRSCEHFIICMPGNWLENSQYVMSCPGGTRFDSHLKICNYASSVDCHH